MNATSDTHTAHTRARARTRGRARTHNCSCAALTAGARNNNTPNDANVSTPEAKSALRKKNSARKSTKKMDENVPFSAEFMGRRGVISTLKGVMPPIVTAFGVTGVLEKDKGHAPQEVEVFGQRGVLQSERGATPEAHKGEGRAAMQASEERALTIAEFIAAHPDAQLISGGKVRCTTTGCESVGSMLTAIARFVCRPCLS